MNQEGQVEQFFIIGGTLALILLGLVLSPIFLDQDETEIFHDQDQENLDEAQENIDDLMEDIDAKVNFEPVLTFGAIIIVVVIGLLIIRKFL